MCILFVVTDRRTAVTFVTECLFLCVCNFPSLLILTLTPITSPCVYRSLLCVLLLSCIVLCMYITLHYSINIHCVPVSIAPTSKSTAHYIYHYSTIYYWSHCPSSLTIASNCSY